MKPGIFVGVIIWAVVSLPSSVAASDSLRTISEFGYRVLANLNCADTLNGNDLVDSTDAQRHVRDAVVDVGTMIPTEKAKTIVTVDGTFGYLVDTHLDSLRMVLLKKGRYAHVVDVVRWSKMKDVFSRMGLAYDTSSAKYAAVHGDSAYIYPIPPRVDTLYLFYTARGAVPTAYTDTVDTPHELYSAIEYLATMRAALSVGDHIHAANYEKLFGIEISKFMGGKTPQ